MNSLQEYRYDRCAGKNCHNIGIYSLRVVYLNRKGWFCDSCKDGLISAGLVKEDNASNAVKNRNDELLTDGGVKGGERNETQQENSFDWL
jgi:hypothetical protein